jgi:hypothetical protein
MNVWRLLILALLLGACNTPVKRTGTFFSFDSLVQTQAAALSRQQAAVSKRVTMQGKTDSVVLALKDSAAWHQELELFTQLQTVNKPQNNARYNVSIYTDVTSNLTVRELAATEALPVQRIKLFYLHEPHRLRKIEAMVAHTSALYQSAQQLTLLFTDINNITMLTGYSVIGGQQMILGDSVQFSSVGSISIR